MKKKTIGIIGGMGPLATADLFQKIILHTEAVTDQEHLHILIDNNTAIPDRTSALLAGGEDPGPQMIKSAQLLESSGADCLIMPCNTAHNYYGRIQESVEIPVLNMLEITCQVLADANITCAGLLATTGTLQTGIYQRICSRYGIMLLIPDMAEQHAVMHMIYKGVKAGKVDYDAAAVQRVARALMTDGAQTIILGCTELPVAMEQYGLSFPFVDPTLELAKYAIRFAGAENRIV